MHKTKTNLESPAVEPQNNVSIAQRAEGRSGPTRNERTHPRIVDRRNERDVAAQKPRGGASAGKRACSLKSADDHCDHEIGYGDHDVHDEKPHRDNEYIKHHQRFPGGKEGRRSGE